MALAAADPYYNIHKKAPMGAKRLVSILEERAADPKQRALRERCLAEVLDGLPPHASVLDVGCGTGALARTAALHPGVASVVGIDPSQVFVDEAARLGATAEGGSKLSFRHGLGTALPLPNASVDVAVIWTVLCHVPKDECRPIIAEAQRVLRPGGRLVIADNDLSGWSCAAAKHDPLSPALAWYIDTYIQDTFLAKKFPSMLADAGLAPRPLQIHTLVDTAADSYGFKHVILRAIDSFAASGTVGPALVAAMKAEAHRRVEAHTFAMVLPYAVAIADKPGGATGRGRAAAASPSHAFGALAAGAPSAVAAGTRGALASSSGAGAQPPTRYYSHFRVTIDDRHLRMILLVK